REAGSARTPVSQILVARGASQGRNEHQNQDVPHHLEYADNDRQPHLPLRNDVLILVDDEGEVERDRVESSRKQTPLHRRAGRAGSTPGRGPPPLPRQDREEDQVQGGRDSGGDAEAPVPRRDRPA